VSRLPSNQNDLAAVAALASASPQQLEEIAPRLIRWLKNPGWPVAGPVADLIAAAGERAVPAVEQVLGSRDLTWKYVVLRDAVSRWPRTAVERLTTRLELLATHTDQDPADLEALALLARHRLATPDWIAQWLRFKRERHIASLDRIAAIEAIRSRPGPPDFSA
jgi:hypothetical protein